MKRSAAYAEDNKRFKRGWRKTLTYSIITNWQIAGDGKWNYTHGTSLSPGFNIKTEVTFSCSK